MKYLIFLTFLFISHYTFSQQLVTKKISDHKINSEFTVIKDSPDVKHGYYRHHDKLNSTISEGFYKYGSKDSVWKITRNKTLTSTGSFKNDLATGVWKSYRTMKKGVCLIDSGEYINDQKVNEWACFDQCNLELRYNYSTKKLIYHAKDSTFYSIISGSDTLLVTPDNPPLYPGGKANFRNKIATEIRFPKEFVTTHKFFARKVTLSFWVSETGTIEEVTVIKKCEEPFNNEAIRVFKYFEGDTWIPAAYEGKPVKSKIILPINFYFEYILD